TLTGFSAFALMALHAGWATWVVRRGAPEQRANFHRYSVAVWTLWLVPYLGGMIAGMMAGAGK
ncbi:MAG: TIGR03987 family protein, partial [Actinobacteria bacterium]|nr:TIGR03987 family protein [Actinomycetota bacterium]